MRPGAGGRKPPAPLLTSLFAILLFVQASALPTHIGLMLIPAHTAAMTHGCEKGTCCTPLCYLDKHGVHHCVHMSGDSCACGLSTDDCTTTNPVFLSALITLHSIDNADPGSAWVPWVSPSQALFAGREPATPTLPPK